MRLGELTPTPLARMVWAGEGDSSGMGLGGQLVAVHHHAVRLPCTKYLKVRKIFTK